MVQISILWALGVQQWQEVLERIDFPRTRRIIREAIDISCDLNPRVLVLIYIACLHLHVKYHARGLALNILLS